MKASVHALGVQDFEIEIPDSLIPQVGDVLDFPSEPGYVTPQGGRYWHILIEERRFVYNEDAREGLRIVRLFGRHQP